MADEKKLSAQEGMKVDSKYLKGDILEELLDVSDEKVSDYSYELLKFHGSYWGYDRDSATARKKQGLDKEYEFMVRARIPAGLMTHSQYLALDEICEKYANGTIRLTTRQTIQFHCIKKAHMKPLVHEICESKLSTLAACGDVVRNVTASNLPYKNAKQARLIEDTYKIVEMCTAKSTAYDEIWNDAPKGNRDGASEIVEPLYGETYLPRKFKIGIIVPEDNSLDVFTHDLGIVAIYEGDVLKGYNILLGGGMGCKHNQPKTYPRLADSIAFVSEDELLKAVEAVVKLQRDFGDRTNRQHARLKYLVEEKGLDWTKKTFDEYFGRVAEAAKSVAKYEIPDHTGWHEQGDGKWFIGVPVSSGRIEDNDEAKIRTSLREIIAQYQPKITLTADQNIILADVEESAKVDIEARLRESGVRLKDDISAVEKNLIACVSLPTCGKALAEAERVKMPMQKDIEDAMEKNGVLGERIAIRIAGCPNGCSRPFIGDIGLVGRMPGHYVLYIGGDFEGTRLNKMVFDKVPEKDVPKALDPMFKLYAAEKAGGEGFGDFCERYGVERIVESVKSELQGFKWAA